MPRPRPVKVDVNRIYDDSYLMVSEEGPIRVAQMLRKADAIALRDRLIELFPLVRK